MYPEPTNAPNFRCPICRSKFYSPVEVRRKDGQKYRTEFLKCSGCSVMFADAAKFTTFEPYEPAQKSAADRRREEVKLAYFEGRQERK